MTTPTESTNGGAGEKWKVILRVMYHRGKPVRWPWLEEK